MACRITLGHAQIGGRNGRYYRAVLLPFLALTVVQPDYHARAISVTGMIEHKYFASGLYCETVSAGGTRSEDVAFAWDLGVLLAASAEELRVEPAAGKRQFATVYKALEPYGRKIGDGFAYAATPPRGEPDLYYDDNEWLALAMVEAYEAGGDKTYLKRAEEVFAWLETGEDEALGGGLYWHANDKKSKNTCSNAPAIVLAAKLYRATHKKAYLDVAVRLYGWVRKLQDSDGLYFDNESLEGKIDKTRWTYNSALMIRGGIELSQATSEGSYLTEAIRVAKAARDHWVDASTGAIKDEAGFAHHLADAWLELDGHDRSGHWRETASRAIDWAFEYTRGDDGLFGHRWDRPIAKGEKRNLLAQASMARVLWHAAKR